jgi:hypothetical protein
MTPHDIENTNLEAHVSICQERYQRLAERLESVDHRIAGLEQGVRDIRDHLERITRVNYSQWDRLRDITIGVLVTAVGYLAAKFLL